MAYPLFLLDIGIEGMNLTPGKNILIANRAERFAAQIIRLYQDEKLWQKLAANAQEALLLLLLNQSEITAETSYAACSEPLVKNNLIQELNLLNVINN